MKKQLKEILEVVEKKLDDSAVTSGSYNFYEGQQDILYKVLEMVEELINKLDDKLHELDHDYVLRDKVWKEAIDLLKGE